MADLLSADPPVSVAALAFGMALLEKKVPVFDIITVMRVFDARVAPLLAATDVLLDDNARLINALKRAAARIVDTDPPGCPSGPDEPTEMGTIKLLCDSADEMRSGAERIVLEELAGVEPEPMVVAVPLTRAERETIAAALSCGPVATGQPETEARSFLEPNLPGAPRG